MTHTAPPPTTSRYRVDRIAGRRYLRLLPRFRRDVLGALAEVTTGRDAVQLVGPWTSHLFTHPDAVEHVLKTGARRYAKGRHFRVISASTGNGLFVSEGETWKRQRRLSQPVFARHNVAGFAPVMQGAVEGVVARWSAAADAAAPIDVGLDMMRLALSVVGLALFGRDLGGEAETLGRVFDVVRTETVYRVMNVLRAPAWLPTPRNRRFDAAVRTANELVAQLIADRRHEAAPVHDLLGMLLAARDDDGSGMTNDALLAESKTLVGAGYETTAQALTWTWTLLAANPAAESRLHAELDGVLGGRTPTADDLGRLPYARMVLLETLRLRPPVWALPRTAAERDTVCGVDVRAGDEILLVPYLTQRLPEFWGDDAESFRPERFAPEEVERRHPFAFVPFGAGPRRCLGEHFAMLEALLAIVTIAQRFRLRPTGDGVVAIDASVTLRPRDAVRMRVIPRD